MNASYSTFFVKKVKDAKLILDEVNARLVVMEVNERPSDLFPHVFLLLQLEHMLPTDNTARLKKPRFF